MRMDASLQMRQEMRMRLAPQIIQSIEILQLPLIELSQRIDQELTENPLLERVEGPAEEPEGHTTTSQSRLAMGAPPSTAVPSSSTF